MSEEISKERSEVPEPEPVSLGGFRYEALPWGKARGLGQNGGFIIAIDEATGLEKWILKVYDVDYNTDMEGDKQDIFINELGLESENLLHVANEREEHYLVNIDTRSVTKWVD
ncbi:MAG: hypothetical protein ACOYMG_10275 [Candidatus Methylumidiphilus sp.]